jgi:hypothetical protein
MRRLKFLRLAAIVPALVVGSVHADEVPPGTVRVASRLFLVVDTPYGSDRVEDVLALSLIRRLRDLLQDDPVLDGASIVIRRRPSLAARLLGPEGVRRHFGNSTAVPEAYRAPGLVSETTDAETPSMLFFQPDVPDPDFMVLCFLDPLYSSELFTMCRWRAAYPPDPAIMLEATLMRPPPFADLHQSFESIADRMREISLCLDVTGKAPREPEIWLRDILEEHPGLTGCQ